MCCSLHTLFKDCVGVSCMYELFKLGVLFPCKSLPEEVDGGLKKGYF